MSNRCFENVTEKLRELKNDDKVMLDLAQKAFRAYNGAIYPFDLLINAAINRNLALSEGFRTMINDRNMICAGSLLRMNLDSALRVYAGFRVGDPHELAISVMQGKQIRKVKDRSGNPMTDHYLISKLSRNHPWIESVYKKTSGYVHLSEIHVFSSLDPNIDPKTGEFGVKIGPRDNDIPEEIYLEAILAFHESSGILAKYVSGWVFTKNNPDKVAEIRKHLENQGIDPILDI